MEYRLVKLKDVGNIVTGNTPSKKNADYWKGGIIPFVSPTELSNTSLIKVKSAKDYITELALEKARLLPKNSILVCCIGSLGKIGISTKELVTNQQINSVICNEKIANYKYVAYAITRLKDTMDRIAPSTTVKIINKTSFGELKVPLPPKPIQIKIANALDKAQELIDNRKAQIEKYEELLQSVFLDMFGDPVANPKGWEVSLFEKTGTLQRGKSKHRPRNAPELLGGKYPLIQTGEVSRAGIFITEYSKTYSELGLKQSRMWKAGTLCITIAANIAETGVLKFDACFPDSIVGFIPNEKFNLHYIQFWLMFLQATLEAQAPQSAQKNINLKILNALKLPAPPITLQNQFAEIVEKVEMEKKNLEKSLVELENNFNSIMQRAFRGELF